MTKAKKPAPKRHVLICDDDDLGSEFISVVLKESGFRVTIRPDGASGLEAILKLKPDVVLLDLEMPGKSGLDVLAELKRSPPPVTPIVIVFSHSPKQELYDTGLALGAAEAIVKPYQAPALVQRIEDLLKEKAA